MITEHHRAVLLNKDAFARGTCAPFQVLARSCLLHGPFEGMVVPKSTRPVVQSFSFLHVANTSQQQRVRHAEVCVHCTRVAHTATCSWSALSRETLAADFGERRVPLLEVALSHANIPWPTFGVTPLWSRGSEPNSGKWPDCFGFLFLPETQTQWLI